MFNILESETDKINHLIRESAASRLTDEEFILNEIRRFKASKRRKAMLDGEKYYTGKHDILSQKRTMIGEGGELEEVKNLPNHRTIDNQYRKMVNQKANYLLGQPIVIRSDNKQYEKLLKPFFNKGFMRSMKNIGKSSLNGGIGWLFIYYNKNGELAFKRFKPFEIIPEWEDEEHTILEGAIHFYEVISYEGKEEKTLEKVEIYDETGISRFVIDGDRLKPDDIPHEAYFTVVDSDGSEQPYNWSKIPLIPWKYNGEEIPLIKNVKSLQDGLNSIISNFQNNMEEDARNTILILVNYDGEKLDEFRKNLATYGAVKVKSVGDSKGDVRSLQIEVNADNYKAILEILKKAIIENAMGYDAKDDRLAGNANQLNIMSMYSDIDLDANEMETEYQASFEELLWFINIHLANTGQGDFEGETVEVIFNRDILISETEVIDNVTKSVDLSEETRIANHPWVDDVAAEMKRKKKEALDAMKDYTNAFNPVPPDNKGGSVDEE